MGNFIAGRLPSRAVLDEFRPCLADVDRGTTPAARAFVVLDAAVTAHAQALDYLDRAERRLNVARMAVGASEARDRHRRRDRDGSAPVGPERLPRRYHARASDRFRPRGLGSRRRAFAVRQAWERRLRDRVGEATDYLYVAPAATIGDLALKLAVFIAAGEAGPPVPPCSRGSTSVDFSPMWSASPTWRYDGVRKRWFFYLPVACPVVVHRRDEVIGVGMVGFVHDVGGESNCPRFFDRSRYLKSRLFLG